MAAPENVLIVRTDRIGDVVLTLPVARALKQAYPGCRVTFLVREYTRAVADTHPHIDDVMVLGERNGRPELVGNAQRIQSRGFDTAVLVHPSFRLACILSLAGVPKRVGTAYRWYSSLLNHRVPLHRKRGPKHEVEYNLELLGPLGIDPATVEVGFDLAPSPAPSESVREVWDGWNLGTDRPVVIVHPGSGGSAVDLPTPALAELVGRLEATGVEVLVTGSNDEVGVCETVTHGARARNLAGKFSLEELVALIARSDLLIANSTGPIHIAAALGKPVVGFYSRAQACAPERWGPYSSRKAVFTPEQDCSGCTLRRCRRTRCMETIALGPVLDAVRELLATDPGETAHEKGRPPKGDRPQSLQS